MRIKRTLLELLQNNNDCTSKESDSLGFLGHLRHTPSEYESTVDNLYGYGDGVCPGDEICNETLPSQSPQEPTIAQSPNATQDKSTPKQ